MTILYVCRSNVVRSQIAETFHNSFGGWADSAGIFVGNREGMRIKDIEHTKNLVTVMEEVNINIAENKLTQLNEDMLNEYSRLIVMAEPNIWSDYLTNNKKVEYWYIEDPKGTDLESHRNLRDQIKSKVSEFIVTCHNYY